MGTDARNRDQCYHRVHPEVLVNDLLHRQAEEVELPIIMVEDVRGQFIVAQLEGLVAHLGSTCQA